MGWRCWERAGQRCVPLSARPRLARPPAARTTPHPTSSPASSMRPRTYSRASTSRGVNTRRVTAGGGASVRRARRATWDGTGVGFRGGVEWARGWRGVARVGPGSATRVALAALLPVPAPVGLRRRTHPPAPPPHPQPFLVHLLHNCRPRNAGRQGGRRRVGRGAQAEQGRGGARSVHERSGQGGGGGMGVGWGGGQQDEQGQEVGWEPHGRWQAAARSAAACVWPRPVQHSHPHRPFCPNSLSPAQHGRHHPCGRHGRLEEGPQEGAG